MKMTEKVWNANQSWYYESLHHLDTSGVDKNKVKIKIRRNAFDEQCWAVAEFFDGKSWNKIASTPHPNMKCMNISYTQKGVTADRFEEDEKILLKEVEMILR